MKQTTSTSPSLTNFYQSSTFGRRTTRLLAIGITIATAIFVSLMGSLVEPDFWQPVQLVDLVANLILFFFISYVAVTPLGYIWHFFLSSVDAAVSLSASQITNRYVPWLIDRIGELRLVVFRRSYQAKALSERAKSLAQVVQTILSRRQPQQRSKSKAPIFLFQQATLLSSP